MGMALNKSIQSVSNSGEVQAKPAKSIVHCPGSWTCIERPSLSLNLLQTTSSCRAFDPHRSPFSSRSFSRLMVFTPPPSPLPPRHSPLTEPQTAPIKTDLQKSKSNAKNYRRFLILLVPVVLIFIGSSSQLLSHSVVLQDDVPIIYSGNFRDNEADSSWSLHGRSFDSSESLAARHRRIHHAAAAKARGLSITDGDVRRDDGVDVADEPVPSGIIPILTSHPTPTVREGAAGMTAPSIATPALPIPTPCKHFQEPMSG